MSAKTFVIVGASLAGAKAAAELRERGFDGRVVLIGAESELPYERPPLSKDYLRGESERDAMRVGAEGFYKDNQIELRLGTVAAAIDLDASQVQIEGHGADVSFDALLLATGADPRRLQV